MLSPAERDVVRGSLRRLLATSPDTEIEALVAAATRLEVAEGEVLVTEGEPAGDAFVLLGGRFGIYVRGAGAGLRRIDNVEQAGSLLGEQALAAGRHFRTATVLALEPATVAALPGALGGARIANDPAAGATLQRQSVENAWRKWRALASELAGATGAAPAQPRQLRAGEVLFEPGDPSPHAYFVLAGEIGLWHPGCPEPSETIGPGLLVGERGTLAGRPRQLRARALSAAELLVIEASALEGSRRGSGPFTTMLEGLATAHDLPTLGTAYRYLAHVGDEACIVTDYSGTAAGRVRVRHFPAGPRTEAVRSGAAEAPHDVASSPDGTVSLMLGTGDRLVGLSVTAPWPHLPALMGLLLRGGAVADWQRRAFAATGGWLEEEAAQRVPTGAEIVCSCTLATAASIRTAAARAATVEDLVRVTGAGGVCGGCRGRLATLLGGGGFSLCRVEIAPLALGAVRARLVPIDARPLPSAAVGQHVRVEGLIDGRWVGRPYTLTAASADGFELGVKLEEGGLFSPWLAAAGPDTLVRVLPPQGNCCPAADASRPLVYVVAGIGVTPAITAVRSLAATRRIHVLFTARSPDAAPYLAELEAAAEAGRIAFESRFTGREGRFSGPDVRNRVVAIGPCDVIVCGPGGFNAAIAEALAGLPGVTTTCESFDHPLRGEGSVGRPGGWRRRPFTPAPPPGGEVTIATTLSAVEQAECFVRQYFAEQRPGDDPAARVASVRESFTATSTWRKTADELAFAARLAWRNAGRCVGRLHWQALHLRDCRHLEDPDAMAEALFEHLRFAFNGGNIRPAITVFAPATRDCPAPRIWNPQLLRYAGLRLRSGRQVGDPAQNALTRRIIDLGWEPAGTDFDLLPLVIETPATGPRLYPLPGDCRPEVALSHPDHPWLAGRGLRWYAVPAVSDMALDAGGITYPFAPFNGWYLDAEIAARNFSDADRYDLLPEIAERMGLDIGNDRTLWRDKAQLMLVEAVLHSFDRAGVKIADHHAVGHEFLEFCRNEQAAGREPYGRWMWLVPPVASSTSVLYREPFRDVSLKPAYRYQRPIWEDAPA
ncbi:MAG: nitric oxide synthase oxygenase [Planctomycetaceae bacterium]